MSEVAAFLALIAAVNPAASALIAGRAVSQREATAAAGIAVVTLTIAAVAADPILDLLDISAESFRVAAGIVLIIAGARAFLPGLRRRATAQADRAEVVYPFAIPALLGPAALSLVVGVSGNENAVLAIGGSIVGVAIGAAAMLGGPRRGYGTAAAFIGALLVIFGVGEIADGVKSV